MQPGLCAQLAVQIIAAVLAVLFARNIACGHGIHAQIRQKQRLGFQICAAPRRHRTGALQRVVHRKCRFVVHKVSLPDHNIALRLPVILNGSQIIVDHGISHHGAVGCAHRGIGRIRPVGWVILAGIPVIVDIRPVRVSAHKQPVGIAVHAKQNAQCTSVDALGIALHRAAGFNFHIVLAGNGAFAGRLCKGHRAGGAVHRKIRAFFFLLPVSFSHQQPALYRRAVQPAKRKLIAFRRAVCGKQFPKRRLQKVQRLVFLAAARRAFGNGQRGDIRPLAGLFHPGSVIHQQRLAVLDIQLIPHLPAAASGIGHAVIQGRIAFIQLAARVDQTHVIAAPLVISVDPPVILGHALIPHALAHLAGHIADHIGCVRAAGLIHKAGGVRKVHAPEFIHRKAAFGRARRNGKNRSRHLTTTLSRW